MKKSIFLTGFLILGGVLFFQNPGFTETIVLRSGETVEGKIIEKTDKYVKVDFIGIPLTYFFEDIESIDGKKLVSPSVSSTVSQPVSSPASLPASPSVSSSVSSPVPSKLEVADDTPPLIKGLEYASKGENDLAEEMFVKASELNKTAIEFDDNVVDALLLFNDFKSGKITKEYASVLFRGRKYSLENQNQQAIAEFEKAAKINPNNPNAYRGLATSNFFSGKNEEALKYLEMAISIAPNDARSYRDIGIIYLATGKNKEAKESFLKAKTIFQNEGESRNSQKIEVFLNQIP
jgi:tetratricopeptide (TPR) repeat protein